jgi:hypothetical protein
VRKRVPIRNELVVQLIRSKGIRRNTSASQDDVLFRPAMDFGAVGAGELVGLQFFIGPKLFFNYLAGRGEFGGGGTPDENSFCHG